MRRSERHLRAALDLEDAGRLGLLDRRRRRRRVVVGDAGEVDALAAPARDQLHAALDRREHPQAEQVDLQEARVGARVLVPHDHLPALHRGGDDRAAVDERAGRDDHPARVLGEVARQAVGLVGQPREPAPAACGRVRPNRPPSATSMSRSTWRAEKPSDAARDALDLPRRQPERLAQLADRAARAVGRERRDERRVVAAVALVHARDEHLAHVAREVEVDVRQRGDLLVEEAPEEEVVGDRVDVREAGEVADDRGDRGAPARGPAAAAPGRCRARAPRPPPRARARAGRGAAGRSPTARAAAMSPAPRPGASAARSRSRWPGG